MTASVSPAAPTGPGCPGCPGAPARCPAHPASTITRKRSRGATVSNTSPAGPGCPGTGWSPADHHRRRAPRCGCAEAAHPPAPAGAAPSALAWLITSWLRSAHGPWRPRRRFMLGPALARPAVCARAAGPARPSRHLAAFTRSPGRAGSCPRKPSTGATSARWIALDAGVAADVEVFKGAPAGHHQRRRRSAQAEAPACVVGRRSLRRPASAGHTRWRSDRSRWPHKMQHGPEQLTACSQSSMSAALRGRRIAELQQDRAHQLAPHPDRHHCPAQRG